MGSKDDERSAARDYCMARLGAAGAALAAARSSLDEAMMLFCDPDQDKDGDRRAEIMEELDDACGAAAISVHQAQGAWEDVDPKEGEPEPDDEPEDEPEEDDKDSKRKR